MTDPPLKLHAINVQNPGQHIVKLIAERDAAIAKYHEAMDIMSEWKNLDTTAAIADKWQVRIDAAVVQGLEIAKAFCVDHRAAWIIADNIQAEIDKRKGTHGNQQ